MNIGQLLDSLTPLGTEERKVLLKKHGLTRGQRMSVWKTVAGREVGTPKGEDAQKAYEDLALEVALVGDDEAELSLTQDEALSALLG